MESVKEGALELEELVELDEELLAVGMIGEEELPPPPPPQDKRLRVKIINIFNLINLVKTSHLQ